MSRRASTARWTDDVFERRIASKDSHAEWLIGMLEGEGIGREVLSAALAVLAALESATPHRFAIRTAAMDESGRDEAAVSQPVLRFCGDVFAAGGAVLAGPVAGRFVYDLRRNFDLFCKLSPVRPAAEVAGAGRMRPEHVRGIDLLLVRENVSGVYQGRWRTSAEPDGGRRAEHTFSYTEQEARRILRVAARLASRRRGHLAVVVKDGGIPGVSDLWRACTAAIVSESPVECRFLNVDLAAYFLVQHPHELDVVVAPNLFGDILADLAGVLLGSRALCYSGNFGPDGAAVYQTNHGAALDLAGTDRANPVGQILALAMMLRESFGLGAAASLVEEAIVEVWRQGWRTNDLREAECRPVGTREMGRLVAAAVVTLASRTAA